MTRKILKYLLWAALTIGGIILGFVYYRFDPASSALFPRCGFRALTHLPCPGCGSQRALHALLHLDFVSAARYNFMVLVLVPILVLIAFSSAMENKLPRLYEITHHKWVGYSLAIIIMAWWVLRIIFGWYV